MKLSHIEIATSDDRGNISDILYKDNVEHVSIINTVGDANIVRGNHYHKETHQRIFITNGGLYYWYKNLDDKYANYIFAGVYDLVETPPYEIHALHILQETQFIVFTSGVRGGIDYESDTFRVDPIVSNKYCYV